MDYAPLAEVGCAGLTIMSVLLGALWRRAEVARDAELNKNSADIERLGKSLADHKLYAAEHYVTQTELTKAIESLDRTMQRLIDAMNHNARETREGIAEIYRRLEGKVDK